ncbi:hypothetical protein PsorP6_000875 [Peronosclerospora sorghi]|uniref:Uncharacterized protein n=1 Tax=Peronosclerospora sorghi TaxID=230839 RepID=A0ACC0WVQ2_9STRA|nr:hypothetical protein PsorP6_000875 [Peronosclerospora sorghi]
MATTCTGNSVELYLVLSNRSGRQNLGTYLRTASAFGATEVLVVGSERFGTHGAHRAQKYVHIVHFYEYEEAREYLKAKDCTIFGLRKQATRSFGMFLRTSYHLKEPVHLLSTMRCGCHFVALLNVALGAESSRIDVVQYPGLSEEQRAICDHFVYVPYYGKQTEASKKLVLDTTVCIAIILHHFASCAQFPVRTIESTNTRGKFVLDKHPTFDTRGREKAALREAQRANRNDGLADGDGIGCLFE